MSKGLAPFAMLKEQAVKHLYCLFYFFVKILSVEFEKQNRCDWRPKLMCGHLETWDTILHFCSRSVHQTILYTKMGNMCCTILCRWNWKPMILDVDKLSQIPRLSPPQLQKVKTCRISDWLGVRSSAWFCDIRHSCNHANIWICKFKNRFQSWWCLW